MISTVSFLLAQSTPPPAPPGGLGMLFPMICIGVVFYFLILRPQNKRQKELAALIASLKTGDKVVTSGGIHGMVANVKDGPTLVLKIADNVKIEVDKSAIASVDRGSGAGSSAKELPAKATA